MKIMNNSFTTRANFSTSEKETTTSQWGGGKHLHSADLQTTYQNIKFNSNPSFGISLRSTPKTIKKQIRKLEAELEAKTRKLKDIEDKKLYPKNSHGGPFYAFYYKCKNHYYVELAESLDQEIKRLEAEIEELKKQLD